MRAKKILSVLLVCVMVFLCSCGKDENRDEDKNDDRMPNIFGQPTEQKDDGTVIITCEEQNFAVKCKPEYSTKFDEENGLTIYTETYDSIPYVLIYRNQNTANMTDVDEYLSQFKEYMKEKYGDRLIEANDPAQYTFGGKSLKGCSFVYELDGFEI